MGFTGTPCLKTNTIDHPRPSMTIECLEKLIFARRLFVNDSTCFCFLFCINMYKLQQSRGETHFGTDFWARPRGHHKSSGFLEVATTTITATTFYPTRVVFGILSCLISLGYFGIKKTGQYWLGIITIHKKRGIPINCCSPCCDNDYIQYIYIYNILEI